MKYICYLSFSKFLTFSFNVKDFWCVIKCLWLLWDSIQPSLSCFPPVIAWVVADEFQTFV